MLSLLPRFGSRSTALASLVRVPQKPLKLCQGLETVQQQPSRTYAKKRAHKLEVGPNRTLAYRQIPGNSKPTIVFVPGLHSYLHMNGMTARALLRYCDLNDYPGIVYDHECIGESAEDPEASRFVLFSHWIEDVKAVVEQLTEGPVVIVGCSMGGWLSLVVAQQMAERLHGLLLYAPALNYVYPYYQRHLAKLPPDLREKLEEGDSHIVGHAYGSALLKKDFAEDSRAYEIDLKQKVQVECPVRILHGLQDHEIPYMQSLELCQALVSDDVDVVFRKNGPHQLEAPVDIEIFLNTLDRMLKDHPVHRH